MFNTFLLIFYLSFCLCYNENIEFNNSEFYDLINREGEIVLDRDYNLDMDIWEVVKPKFSSFKWNN